MRKINPFIIIILLIVICSVSLAIFGVYAKVKPNDEHISIAEVFEECPADRVLIYRNHELQDGLGIYDNSRAYISLDYVYDEITNVFYFDSDNRQILYTTAEQVITLGADDLYMFKTEPYISVDAVTRYSDISSRSQLGGEVNRVYLYDNNTSFITGILAEDTALRTGESLKEPCLSDLTMGSSVDVLSDPYADESEVPKDAWIYVMSGDGIPGYIPRRSIESFKETHVVSDFAAPEFSHHLLSTPVLMAWHQTTSQSSNRYLDDMVAHTSGINVISPTWYSVTGNDGSISSLASLDYVQRAHTLGMYVWALVDNFSPDINSVTLLSSTSSRRNLINNLISECEFYDIDGINIDFEMLPEEAEQPFAQFIRELSIETRKRGLILSIDNPAAAAYNLYYGRGTQALVADYVINMGYDEHYAGGDAGSVASLPFELNSLELCLEEVPEKQLISGIPLYTRIWTVSGNSVESRAVGLAEAKQWISDNSIQLTWDELVCQYYGERQNGAMTEKIWLEENDSLSLKVNLARDLHLGGIACWKLGLDDAEAWEVIHY